MRRHISTVFGLLLVAVLIAIPSPASAVAQSGLQGDNTYQSPQFGYTVTWGEDWTVRQREVISNRGGFDTLMLRSSLGTLLVQGQGVDGAAADAVTNRIPIEGKADDVVARDLDGDVPMVRMTDGRTMTLIESRTLATDGTVVLVVLSARAASFDAALDSVQAQVRLDDNSILTGDGNGNGDVDETPVATEPAPTEAATVPPATAEVTETPVDLVTPTDVSDGSYTSPLYGFSFTFDPDLWTVADVEVTDDSDIVKLEGDTGLLTIWSWDDYGADPVACLDGESGWYGTEDAAVSNWTPVEDANGDPIRYETGDNAYGVFSLTYSDPDNGESIDLVDYIECRAIPGEDTVVIIHGSATPERYNDHLDAVLDVAETITFAP